MNKPIQGETPSEEEIFYKQWGYETLKNNISTLNDIFKILIGLNTALLSGYLGFYDKLSISNSVIKALPILLIFSSLLASIIGVFPKATTINLNVPSEVKAFKEKRFQYKKSCLSVSAVALLLGYVAFIIARIVG